MDRKSILHWEICRCVHSISQTKPQVNGGSNIAFRDQMQFELIWNEILNQMKYRLEIDHLLMMLWLASAAHRPIVVANGT